MDIKGIRNSFERFAKTFEPVDLEDGLNSAKECDDESSKKIARNLISNAQRIIIDKLKVLSVASSWEDNPADIENCLISASMLIDFESSKSSDVVDLYDKVLRRCNDEKVRTFEKEFIRVVKKDADRKGDKK
ncbi:MAG: hypothetical protein ABSG42_06380 [Nitrospirota bacterium]